jgi:hypothetical protein
LISKGLLFFDTPCSEKLLKKEKVLKLLEPKKVAPNAKSCSKVVEHNRDMPASVIPLHNPRTGILWERDCKATSSAGLSKKWGRSSLDLAFYFYYFLIDALPNASPKFAKDASPILTKPSRVKA